MDDAHRKAAKSILAEIKGLARSGQVSDFKSQWEKRKNPAPPDDENVEHDQGLEDSEDPELDLDDPSLDEDDQEPQGTRVGGTRVGDLAKLKALSRKR